MWQATIQKFLENGFEVVGIDFCNHFIDEAKKKVSGVKFFKKDILKIDFPSNDFDGIWANSVLLHLKKSDFKKALKIFKKILKKEGFIYISLKEGKGEGSSGAESEKKEKRYCAYYLPLEIKNYLKEVGLKLVYLKSFSDDIRKNEKWIRIIAQKI